MAVLGLDLLLPAVSAAGTVIRELRVRGGKRVQRADQLAGEIRNRSTAEKTYTLNIEFLDKSGAVVGQGSATVDKVAPRGTGRFSLTGTAPGIVAFRYKPIG